MKTPARSSKDLGAWASRAGELAREFAQAKPFPHLVLDGFLEESFARELLESFPPYDDARFRNAHGDRGKAERPEVRELGPAYRRLDDLISSRPFLGLMEELSGQRDLVHDPYYFGGGTHENLADMELHPHVDFIVHPNKQLYRRLNLLLYLNPVWEKAWGGALELHDDPWTGAPPAKSIEPLFNRCVLFATSGHSWHGFQRLNLPAGKSRRSFALYLYTKKPAPDSAGIPTDLTVFVPKPLSDRFGPGYTLDRADSLEIQRAVIERDRLLKHLYNRSIGLARRLDIAEENLANLLAAFEGLKKKGESAS